MATIDMNISELRKGLNKDYSIEELEAILFDFGLEIDSYDKDTGDLKIEVTAERVDLLSPAGLLRALKAYLGISKPSSYSVKKGNYTLNIDDSVRPYRPHSVCAVVKNLSLTTNDLKQVINAQEKLHQTIGRKRGVVAIGVYPLDKICFPITLLSKRPEDIKFVPLGEDRELNGREILEQTAVGREYSCLLEGKDKYPIFIDSNNQILSMPPIINSEAVGKLTEDTKDIFIECSGFNTIRLEQTLNLLCTMFADMGGELYSVDVTYGKSYNLKPKPTPNLSEETRLVSHSHINTLIGTAIDIDTACLLLGRMCYRSKKFGKDKIEVVIPIFRTDVLHEVDIIDDVARAYGYNNIPLKLPKVFTIGSTLKEKDKQEAIIDNMALLGFVEVSPLSLSSKQESFYNLNLPYNADSAIELGFSKDKRIDIVCPSQLPMLLKILTNNQHMHYPQNIFVCDYVVIPDDSKENRASQLLSLCALTADSTVSFTELSSVLLSLCNVFGVHLELRARDYQFYIKGRSAEIIISGKSAGHIGELAPSVLRNFGYAMPVVAFEIDTAML